MHEKDYNGVCKEHEVSCWVALTHVGGGCQYYCIFDMVFLHCIVDVIWSRCGFVKNLGVCVLNARITLVANICQLANLTHEEPQIWLIFLHF